MIILKVTDLSGDRHFVLAEDFAMGRPMIRLTNNNGGYLVDKDGAARFIRRDNIADGFATEPTEQGNQYVIPGCEKDKTRGPKQMDLF